MGGLGDRYGEAANAGETGRRLRDRTGREADLRPEGETGGQADR